MCFSADSFLFSGSKLYWPPGGLYKELQKKERQDQKSQLILSFAHLLTPFESIQFPNTAVTRDFLNIKGTYVLKDISQKLNSHEFKTFYESSTFSDPLIHPAYK